MIYRTNLVLTFLSSLGKLELEKLYVISHFLAFYLKISSIRIEDCSWLCVNINIVLLKNEPVGLWLHCFPFLLYAYVLCIKVGLGLHSIKVGLGLHTLQLNPALYWLLGNLSDKKKLIERWTTISITFNNVIQEKMPLLL